jgi:hypothetical protein
MEFNTHINLDAYPADQGKSTCILSPRKSYFFLKERLPSCTWKDIRRRYSVITMAIQVKQKYKSVCPCLSTERLSLLFCLFWPNQNKMSSSHKGSIKNKVKKKKT